MNLTTTEIMEPLIIAVMCVYGWHSPIRTQSLYSCLAFALFLAVCHLSLGYWDDDPRSFIMPIIASHLIAWSHIQFRYDWHGFAVAVLFALIGAVGAIAALGAAPISIDNGPGADAWTIISVMLYLAMAAYFKGVHHARKLHRVGRSY